MSAIDAFIDHSYNDVPATLRYVPRLRRADKIQTVQLTKQWIIRHRIDAQDVVRFRIQHIIARVERGDSFERFIRGHARDAETVNQIRTFEAINLDGNR